MHDDDRAAFAIAVEDVAALAALEGVVTEAAAEHVLTGATAQEVVVGAAPDGVVVAFAEERVLAGAAIQRVIADAAVGLVVAVAAVEDVVALEAEHVVIAAEALDVVADLVADEDVGVGAALGVLDGHAEGDGNVLGQAADVGERAGTQVDELLHGAARVAVARGVERIDAARVPDGEDGFGVLCEIERVQPLAVYPFAGVRVEAVDGVAGARGVVGAVDRLNGGDVMQHRARQG